MLPAGSATSGAAAARTSPTTSTCVVPSGGAPCAEGARTVTTKAESEVHSPLYAAPSSCEKRNKAST